MAAWATSRPERDAHRAALAGPVAAATSEITRGRIETRTLRVLPCPGAPASRARSRPAHRAVCHVQEERPMAHPGRGCPLPHQPRGGRDHAGRPARHVRGHWRVEHAHWLRDVIWKEDKHSSAPETPPRSGPPSRTSSSASSQHGVTSYTAETRRCAQDPGRALRSGPHSPSRLAKHPPRLWQPLALTGWAAESIELAHRKGWIQVDVKMGSELIRSTVTLCISCSGTNGATRIGHGGHMLAVSTPLSTTLRNSTGR